MALQGTFQDFGLSDILQLISLQRKTGILTIRSDHEAVRIVFHEGAIIDADVEPQCLEERLGEVLVRTGRITRTQLEQALAVQRKTLQRLGLVLIETGIIDEKTLREALEIQISQIVYRTFRWESGSYHFENRDDIQYDPRLHVKLSTDNVLLEGIQIIDEWPVIQKRIPNTQMVFSPRVSKEAIQVREDAPEMETSAEPSSPAETITMSPEAFQVFSLVDGNRTVQEIIDRSPLPEFTVLKCLFELSNRDLIEPVHTTSTGTVGIKEVSPEITVLPETRPRLGRWVAALTGIGLFLLAWVRPLGFTGPSHQPSAQSIRRPWAVALLRTMATAHYILYGRWPESVQALPIEPVGLHWIRDPRGRWFHLASDGFNLTLLDPAGDPLEVLTPPAIMTATTVNPVEDIRFVEPFSPLSGSHASVVLRPPGGKP